MSPFTPRLEILPSTQRSLWPYLGPSIALGFVLYGGTAIALRLGHRTSVDFDFFTEASLDRAGLDQGFPFLRHATVIQERPETLTVLASPEGSGSDNQVKVSFFGGIAFGRVGTPQPTQDGVLLVASLLDLLATKLKVLLQRVEAKDYRDIAAILRTGLSLQEGLAAAGGLFGPAFQPREALKALTYFQGGDLARLSAADKTYLTRAASAVHRVGLCALASRSLSAQH